MDDNNGLLGLDFNLPPGAEGGGSEVDEPSTSTDVTGEDTGELLLELPVEVIEITVEEQILVEVRNINANLDFLVTGVLPLSCAIIIGVFIFRWFYNRFFDRAL